LNISFANCFKQREDNEVTNGLEI